MRSFQSVSKMIPVVGVDRVPCVAFPSAMGVCCVWVRVVNSSETGDPRGLCCVTFGSISDSTVVLSPIVQAVGLLVVLSVPSRSGIRN